MSIEKFVVDKNAEIKRLQDCQRANKLGNAALVAARERGLLMPASLVHDIGVMDRDNVLTPFVKLPNQQQVAVLGHAVGRMHEIHLIVEADSKLLSYARARHFPPAVISYDHKILGGLAAADGEVVDAFAAIAIDLRVDIQPPEFEPKEVTMHDLGYYPHVNVTKAQSQARSYSRSMGSRS